MGQLDQFAKQTFADETPAVTHGAIEFQPTAEIGLSDVRLDGLLAVCNPALLDELVSPWSLARGHDEIVLEIKMPGDHLDFPTVDRALLRRQARQVRRGELPTNPFRGEEPLWIVAPNLPASLGERFKVERVAPGCYRIGPAWFAFLWIAANELPLTEELVPFLVARSGRALNEFAHWGASQRPSAWLSRMVAIHPMLTTLVEELYKNWSANPTDDPEILAIRERTVRFLLNEHPEVRNQVVEEGLAPLVHQFERRLRRPLDEAEHATLRSRLRTHGPDRLGDVVLDLSSEDLAAWLADPAAT
ncbi:hypothetical protein [Polyangium aurulentum]|uniref:hypothetical protein n=1 Tax=Polyangium aurulentum TaxID=2567896 RepID=UPI0010AE71C7|nr:hypothetical protein [Polyangium aurulentum]UQA61287.1 hypothetical protein E8A73_012735 [Polyangium aurulentum]